MNEHDRENIKWAEECRYLARLLETDGNANVPKDSILTYFRVQTASARKDRFYALTHTLENISWLLRDGKDRASSIEALRAHAAALDGSR